MPGCWGSWAKGLHFVTAPRALVSALDTIIATTPEYSGVNPGLSNEHVTAFWNPDAILPRKTELPWYYNSPRIHRPLDPVMFFWQGCLYEAQRGCLLLLKFTSQIFLLKLLHFHVAAFDVQSVVSCPMSNWRWWQASGLYFYHFNPFAFSAFPPGKNAQSREQKASDKNESIFFSIMCNEL